MDWIYLNDPFIALAKESRPRAIKVADYSYAALEERQLDAFFGPLFTAFKLVYDPMKAEQADWQNQRGTQKASTKSVDDLLKELSPEKINQWEREIGIVFAPGTPQYVALLPNGLAPFGATQKKDNRILAVKTLGLALTGIAALGATKTAVDNFFTSINTARTGQKGEISNTKEDSGELTDAMMNCMVGLYVVLGSCIAKFPTQPEEIKPIFDISTIRDIAQTQWIGTVKKGATENIAKRLLSAGRFMKIKVDTDKPLKFWLADEKNDPAGAKSITIQGGEEEIVDVTNMQQSDTSSFLKVVNLDNDVEGHFKVEILPQGGRGIAN